jgi:hypothetical protein
MQGVERQVLVGLKPCCTAARQSAEQVFTSDTIISQPEAFAH